MTTDTRLQQLHDWVKRWAKAPFQLEPASEDASFRRYFRIHLSDRTLIAMDAPPTQEDCAPFIRVQRLFSSAGLHLPRIHAQDIAQGFLLLTDLGSNAYLQCLNADSVDRLYGQAMDSLCTLQKYSCNRAQALPIYNAEMLLQEMELFEEWFLRRLLGITPDAHIQGLLHSVKQRLLDSAQQQPKVWVHRDYHSRNLMFTDNNNPGIIDFQDAVTGPVTYDLVSLLRDSYIAWPADRVRGWAMQYLAMAQQEGIVSNKSSTEQWLQWFDWMGMQRHLKVLGIFSRLKLRDGKDHYLKNLPLTFQYLLQSAQRYPEFNEFSRWLEKQVKPLIQTLL